MRQLVIPFLIFNGLVFFTEIKDISMNGVLTAMVSSQKMAID